MLSAPGAGYLVMRPSRNNASTMPRPAVFLERPC
jgi:hypothetical protein